MTNQPRKTNNSFINEKGLIIKTFCLPVRTLITSEMGITAKENETASTIHHKTNNIRID